MQVRARCRVWGRISRSGVSRRRIGGGYFASTRWDSECLRPCLERPRILLWLEWRTKLTPVRYADLSTGPRHLIEPRSSFQPFVGCTSATPFTPPRSRLLNPFEGIFAVALLEGNFSLDVLCVAVGFLCPRYATGRLIPEVCFA